MQDLAFYITMFVIWAVVFIIAIVIETNTVQQIGSSAVIASVVALLVHVFESDKYWPEFVAFGVTWVVMWIILFLIFGRFSKKLHDSTDGYLDFINKEYIANEGNENGFGSIAINDKIIRFKSNDKIKKGDKVFAESIKGVTLTVRLIKKTK